MIIDINKNVFIGHENGLFEEENYVCILIYVCKSRGNFFFFDRKVEVIMK